MVVWVQVLGLPDTFESDLWQLLHVLQLERSVKFSLYELVLMFASSAYELVVCDECETRP